MKTSHVIQQDLKITLRSRTFFCLKMIGVFIAANVLFVLTQIKYANDVREWFRTHPEYLYEFEEWMLIRALLRVADRLN